MDKNLPSPSVLTWNNQQHRLAEVLRTAKMGPTIKVKEAEIAVSPLLAITAADKAPVAEVESPDVVFYKHDGHYVVFAGQKAIASQKADKKYQGEIRGRLISGPMLKKTRIEVAQAPERAEPPRNNFGEEFANRPRFVDRGFIRNNEPYRSNQSR